MAIPNVRNASIFDLPVCSKISEGLEVRITMDKIVLCLITIYRHSSSVSERCLSPLVQKKF